MSQKPTLTAKFARRGLWWIVVGAGQRVKAPNLQYGIARNVAALDNASQAIQRLHLNLAHPFAG